MSGRTIAFCIVSVLAGTLAPAPALAKTPCASGGFAIVGGTKAQRALARLTAGRVGGVSLSCVVFRPPTTALRREHVRGTEMVVSSRHPGTVRSTWEQQLYVGAYLAYVDRWPKARIAAAAAFDTEGPVDRLTPYDVFGSNPKTAIIVQFERKLFNAAVRAKARVVEERVATLPARAIAITVRVSDPAAFLKHRAISLLRILEPVSAPILGYYLGVEDANGALVFATSHLPNTGSVYVVRSLDSCSPVAHTEAFGIQPPPRCPAK